MAVYTLLLGGALHRAHMVDEATNRAICGAKSTAGGGWQRSTTPILPSCPTCLGVYTAMAGGPPGGATVAPQTVGVPVLPPFDPSIPEAVPISPRRA